MGSIDNTSNIAWDKLGLAAPTAERSSQNLEQEQFLELMVAQLKNQDPFKPMENGEFLTQIAQFGTVDGIRELQSSFSALAVSLQSNQALQASSMVGRSVLVPSGSAQLRAGEGLLGAIDLPDAASDVTLTITNEAGQLVNRLRLGAQQAGVLQFSWDGLNSEGQPMAAGAYHVAAEAIINGRNNAVETLAHALVESVTVGQSGQGLTLNLADFGPKSFSDVRHIL